MAIGRGFYARGGLFFGRLTVSFGLGAAGPLVFIPAVEGPTAIVVQSTGYGLNVESVRFVVAYDGGYSTAVIDGDRAVAAVEVASSCAVLLTEQGIAVSLGGSSEALWVK